MRITQNIMQRSALNTMQGQARQLALAQQRAMTGLRVQKASDDPAAAMGVMQAGGSLRALEQYRRNIGSAQSRVDGEESALDGLSNLLVRAKELALGQVGGTSNEASRAVIKAEVDQLLQSAVQLGNTQVAGEYVFGGNRAGSAPVAWDRVQAPGLHPELREGYNHSTEIASGQRLKVNHNAWEVFPQPIEAPEIPGDPTDPAPPAAGPSRNALEALFNLSRALGANDAEAINSAIGDLDASFDHVQNLIGDTGARSNQLRLTTANLEALDTNLRVFKSDLEEVDLEKAITDLVGKQTAYQAAMMATSRVMGMTLMDYLR